MRGAQKGPGSPGLKNVTFEYKSMCTIDHFLVLKIYKDLMVLRFNGPQISNLEPQTSGGIQAAKVGGGFSNQEWGLPIPIPIPIPVPIPILYLYYTYTIPILYLHYTYTILYYTYPIPIPAPAARPQSKFHKLESWAETLVRSVFIISNRKILN